MQNSLKLHFGDDKTLCSLTKNKNKNKCQCLLSKGHQFNANKWQFTNEFGLRITLHIPFEKKKLSFFIQNILSNNNDSIEFNNNDSIEFNNIKLEYISESKSLCYTMDKLDILIPISKQIIYAIMDEYDVAPKKIYNLYEMIIMKLLFNKLSHRNYGGSAYNVSLNGELPIMLEKLALDTYKFWIIIYKENSELIKKYILIEKDKNEDLCDADEEKLFELKEEIFRCINIPVLHDLHDDDLKKIKSDILNVFKEILSIYIDE